MSASAAPSLQVDLDLFRGPLHTLLELIERRELAVTHVSLVEITDQYLALVGQMPVLDLELTAEFLHVAARLLLLKSAALLPRVADDDGPDDDEPGEDLEARVLAYRRYRDAARALAQRQDAGLRSFGPATTPAQATVPPPGGVEIDPRRLQRMAQRLLARARAAELARAAAPSPLVPFTQVLQTVVERLRGRRRIDFHSIAAEATDVVTAVTMFLAVLELVRRRRVVIQQHHVFGPIDVMVEGER